MQKSSYYVMFVRNQHLPLQVIAGALCFRHSPHQRDETFYLKMQISISLMIWIWWRVVISRHGASKNYQCAIIVSFLPVESYMYL